MELRSNNGDKMTAFSTDNSVELTCEMSGFIRPDESLTWEGPDGRIIMSGNSFLNNASSPEAAADGSDDLVPSRISTLVISNPVASDSGNYTCRVSDTLQSVTIELFVNGSVTLDPMTSGKYIKIVSCIIDPARWRIPFHTSLYKSPIYYSFTCYCSNTKLLCCVTTSEFPFVSLPICK